MAYYPKPIDVSDIVLNSECENVVEILAKNTHEIWALGRISEGWKYGEIYDYENKIHPQIKPYEELSESEKEYDRRTAMNAIKVAVKLGVVNNK